MSGLIGGVQEDIAKESDHEIISDCLFFTQCGFNEFYSGVYVLIIFTLLLSGSLYNNQISQYVKRPTIKFIDNESLTRELFSLRSIAYNIANGYFAKDSGLSVVS